MSVPFCAPPDPTPHAPCFELSELACDCHAHIFGPEAQFPLVPDRLYTPPEASLAAYERLLTKLGFSRGVIVQPSVYGTDNRATLEAVASVPDRFRAVVVVDGGITHKDLQKMHDAGARGVRANLLFSGERALADVKSVAAKIDDFGWHLQVLLDVSVFPNLHEFFSALPVPTVFDHMGHAPAHLGTDHEGFRALLRLMTEGKAWAKLSGAYRITSRHAPPYPDVDPVARALIAANPEQVVWGSDWPHPHFPGAMPNDGDLLDQLADWAPSRSLRTAILSDNPARLYDFKKA